MTGLRVLYEDERILAADKPCGQAVIPERGDSPVEPLVGEVSRHLGAKAFVVHRIDKETSGVVLFAKDPETHRGLCRLFEKRRIKKTYLALVQGRVASDGIISQPLKEFGSGRVGVHPAGKASRTRYRVVRLLGDATLLEVEPLSGRRHQIRAHLFSVGHPILGDRRYGKPLADAPPRLMLHALEISLELDKPLRLRAEPPGDFKAELDRRKNI